MLTAWSRSDKACQRASKSSFASTIYADDSPPRDLDFKARGGQEIINAALVQDAGRTHGDELGLDMNLI